MQSILSVIARQISSIRSLIANKTFESLVDTDTQNAEPNDVLIYANGKWTADSSSVFGLIDGGFSDANYTEALNIDGGSA